MSIMEHEYLTFFLDGEEYGVDILRVQEIRVWSPVTELPNTPPYMKGVINLRGIIVPIVDLRERFNRNPLSYDATTVVIVLRAEKDNKQMIVGIVVDAVSEVYKVTANEIRKAPDFGGNVDDQFIKGMATVAEKMIILLDADTLLDTRILYQVNRQMNDPAIKQAAAQA